jgi:hypothetical protein
MEKRERLNDIRNGKLPEEFIQKYQSLSSLILRITNTDFSERPDATELIDYINDEIFSTENDFVIIAKKNNGRRTRFNSDDLTIEYDYLVIDVNYSDRLDSTMIDSDFTRSISVDTLYENYDSDYEGMSSSYFLDYSWHYILTGKTS